MTIPTEDEEQMWLCQWAKMNRVPLVHIANQRMCTVNYGRKLKRMGLQKGFPDLFLPMPNKIYHGMFIEMKRRKGGIVSPDQEYWIKYLNANGYLCIVCEGWEIGKKNIEKYLNDV